MDTANNKTLNCTGEDKDKEECNISEQTVKQFQILIVIVFILLIFFWDVMSII